MTKKVLSSLVLCLIAFLVIGCSDTSNLITPNQIDTILSTCDTDIELGIANENYTGTFDINKACVDNILLTTNPVNPNPIGTDPPHPTLPVAKGSLVQQVSVSQLVEDTKALKKSYEGSLISLSAEVKRNSDNKTLWLTTNDDISFAVFGSGDRATRQFKKQYNEGETYDLILYVREQEQPNLTNDFTFDDNRWFIWTYLVKDSGNINNITIDELASDTKQGGTTYEGDIVSFNTKVKFVLGNSITLETNDNDIVLFLRSAGDALTGKFQQTYISGNAYDFILYIREQEQNADDWSIWSYIIE